MESSRDQIAKTVSEYWNIRDDLKGKTSDEIQAAVRASQLPFSVAAFNITGDLNLGVIMRTAVLFGAKNFYIIGRKRYDRRSTVGAHHYINIDHIDPDETDPRHYLDRRGQMPIFVEQGGTDFRRVDARIYRMVHAKTPCFIFGNEGMGIPPEYLKGSLVMSIPQRGVLRSLNVAASAAIIIEHFAHQLAQ